MKELTKTRRLVYAAAIFILIIVVGFLTFKKPEITYNLTAEEMLHELYNPEKEVLPDEILEYLAYGNDSIVLVDLRPPYIFANGTLDSAINIPVSDIPVEENLELFEYWKNNNLKVILFGDDQHQANAAWMWLTQTGFDNVRILLGGYDYFKIESDDPYAEQELPSYFAEEPAMDFATFIKENSSNQNPGLLQQEQKKSVAPVRRKKKTVTEGGC
ncbi:MAG: hypothetical protein Kow00127_04550 [Bacteroidales bacterium]